MTVVENVAFGLERQRRAEGRGSQRASPRSSSSSSSPGSRGASRAQLSGGQQQRVALARALVNNPRVLLLDEPLGALDLKLRKQMQLELKRIQHEVGITFVHVTHDQEEAMTMADTIAVMNGGRIEQLGTPAELYERPRDGVRRRLPRHVEPARGDGRGRRRDPARRRLDERPRVARTARAGTSSIGVRPEKISLRDGGVEPALGQGARVCVHRRRDRRSSSTRRRATMTVFHQNIEAGGVARRRASQ